MENEYVTLRPHQREAVDKMHNGCILTGDVGSGKTIAALAYYVENHQQCDIIVITTARKRDDLDWRREAALFGIGTTPDSSLHGTITVDSWNNIGKYKDVENAFFVFDEQRVVGRGAWVKSFLRIAQHNLWIMLSATPGDTWLDYVPVFIANGHVKNITQFKRDHVVYKPYTKYPKVDRYVHVGQMVRWRNEIIVPMPFVRHTKRETEIIEVRYNKEAFEKAVKTRWNPDTNRPIRNVAELFSVLRRITNSNGSRVSEVVRLQKRHDRLIVFYNFDYELEALRRISGVEIKEWNGHKHEKVPESDRWLYLVQYASGAEGWNCVSTDAMCFYSLTYSYKHFHQAHGRIDRLNTPYQTLYYYVLRSRSKLDLAIWRALKGKKSFNEGDFDGFGA